MKRLSRDELDTINAIIDLRKKDYKITYAEIAKKIKISRYLLDYRIREAEKKGYIKKYPQGFTVVKDLEG